MKEQKVTGVIDSLKRLRNAADGNPRYRVMLQSGQVLHTAPGAAVAFVISNSEYLGAPVELTLRNDMIVQCELVKS